jgi:hypothetical protein
MLLLHQSITSRRSCKLEGPGSYSLNTLNSSLGGFHVPRFCHKSQEVNLCTRRNMQSSVISTFSVSENTEKVKCYMSESTLTDRFSQRTL